MNSMTNLTPRQRRHAADLQERILALQQELDQVLESGRSTDIAPTIKRRRLSARGIANIRPGARKRWAEARAGNGGGDTQPKRRRKMSAAGRASISARMKARWRAAKKAGLNAL